MTIDFSQWNWINPPQKYFISETMIELITDPRTDFWQRSYYGFRNDNAPAFLVECSENFTFSAKAINEYQHRYDQSGLIIYLDSENWFKASIEYENEKFSRLGSVVTNLGYSDWATTDIALPKEIWYRLSRRGPDFLIEYALDGEDFKQMRVFHMQKLGETTPEMGKQNPPSKPDQPINIGIYACSPLDSSFSAKFMEFKFEPCQWQAHE